MTTDIVVTTCERLPLLKQTLEYIWERTTTPYRLHVIDDASPNAKYVSALEAHVAKAWLHQQRVGIPSHLRALERITQSDPIVFTDDDALCPKLDPDWLARGLAAMRQFPKVGLLALNNPQCAVDSKRGKETPGDLVTLCRNVSGQFVFVRRAVLTTCHPPDGVRSPVKVLCRMATARNWQVGYLTHVYCQHIGSRSVRTGKDFSRLLELVPPVDGDTLEPAAQWRG
jgi:hypothetical protein